ncbi:MAG: YqgE/AlgH family protein [Desulfobacterales bacterium]
METRFEGSLKGQFLIAMPGLLDPNFYQTVVCISEHTDEGALGLVINRVHSSLQARSIFEELSMPFNEALGETPIHLGGPVHLGEIFILHGPPFDADSSFVITPSLALSNTREVLQRIARGKGPESYIISLGCSGWGAGQLENEIRENAWLSCDVFEDVLFQTPVEQRWEAALKRMGIEPALLTDSAGHA